MNSADALLDVCLLGRSTIGSYIGYVDYFRQRGFRPVSMLELSRASRDARLLGLRHDVDHSLIYARIMAEIEAREGMSASYYFLPPGDYDSTSNYYGTIVDGHIEHAHDFVRVVMEIAALGHEIGIHHDFVQLSQRTDRPVQELFADEIAFFESIGISILGTCSHGSRFARQHEFTNYHVFAAPKHPQPGRVVSEGSWAFELGSLEQSTLGLEYEAYWVETDLYVSDVGSAIGITDKRSGDYVRVDDGGPAEPSLLLDEDKVSSAHRVVMLTHPEWWRIPGSHRGVLGFGAGDGDEARGHRVHVGACDGVCQPSCRIVAERAADTVSAIVNFTDAEDEVAPRQAAVVSLGREFDRSLPEAPRMSADTRCRPFAPKRYAADMAAIAAAANARRPTPLAAREVKNIAAFGGAPRERVPFAWPRCSLHWKLSWGLFRAHEGRRQGVIRVDDRLRAHLAVRRFRDFVLLSGTTAYLGETIEIDTLMAEVIRWLAAADSPYTSDVRYVVCGAWPANDRAAERLRRLFACQPLALYADCQPHTIVELLGQPYA